MYRVTSPTTRQPASRPPAINPRLLPDPSRSQQQQQSSPSADGLQPSPKSLSPRSGKIRSPDGHHPVPSVQQVDGGVEEPVYGQSIQTHGTSRHSGPTPSLFCCRAVRRRPPVAARLDRPASRWRSSSSRRLPPAGQTRSSSPSPSLTSSERARPPTGASLQMCWPPGVRYLPSLSPRLVVSLPRHACS